MTRHGALGSGPPRTGDRFDGRDTGKRKLGTALLALGVVVGVAEVVGPASGVYLVLMPICASALAAAAIWWYRRRQDRPVDH